MMIGRPLSARDRQALTACGISPATAEAAGLRRLTSAEGATLTARKDTGTYAGIGFPYRLPGETAEREWRLRRDTPDIEQREDGPHEVAKYLSPAGARNMVYFPPGVTAADLADTNKDIVITEGEKKTLALWEMARTLHLNQLAIGISGVWNWKGTTGKTTGPNGERQDVKGMLPDFDRIEWEGRKVFIAFDRDAAINWKVRAARFKLALHLQRKKAHCYIVEIPATSDEKGIDDVIGARGPQAAHALLEAARPANPRAEVEALVQQAPTLTDQELREELTRLIAPMNMSQEVEARALVRKELPARVQLPDLDKLLRDRRQFIEARRRERTGAAELTYTGKQYEESASGLIWWKRGQDSQHAAITLANFAATITADVVRDDGSEKTRALKIAAHVGDRAGTFTISAAEFNRMEWPIEHMGARAIVYPGYRDHLRTAIQLLSTNKEEHHTYLHTGWSIIGDRHVYMHSGGGISATGNDPSIVVELPAKLTAYKLPDPPKDEELKAAIAAALHTLNIAPVKYTFPLFAAVWRSVLGPVDCSIFLAGQTGTGKSEIAAIMQQFFGATMNAKNLPAGWESTANALESLAHTVKNALMVVDDFVPRGGSHEVQRLHAVADRLLRGQGNASGRARMGADTALRTPKFPRGLIVGTGEDVPRGHSLRARLIILEFELTDMDWRCLTQCQAEARGGLYAQAMSGFIQWIADKMPAMPARIEEMFANYRARWPDADHKRTPSNLANLAIGLELFLEFAVERGAIADQSAASLKDQAAKTFGLIANDQAKEQEYGEPCQVFLENLQSSISSGMAHLASRLGQVPEESPHRWGWRQDTVDLNRWTPQGARAGWVDGEDIYIDPSTAYKLAQQFQPASGEQITVTLATLKRRLKQQKRLASTDPLRESITIRRVCGGDKREVLHFYGSLIEPLYPRKSPDNSDTATDTPPQPGECRDLNDGKIGQNGHFDRLPTHPNHIDSITYDPNVGSVGEFPTLETRSQSAEEGNKGNGAFGVETTKKADRKHPTPGPQKPGNPTPKDDKLEL